MWWIGNSIRGTNGSTGPNGKAFQSTTFGNAFPFVGTFSTNGNAFQFGELNKWSYGKVLDYKPDDLGTNLASVLFVMYNLDK